MDPTYVGIIPASVTLPDMALRIEAEEALWGEFKEMSVGYYKGKVCTTVEFTDHLKDKTYKRPPVLELDFAEPDSPAPAKKKKVWSGVVLVEGEPRYVAAYRSA